MHPRPVSDRRTVKEEAFPDDFIMVPGGYSSFLETSRLSEKEAARPIDQIEILDPCKITDEERELLQRFKRRQDAFKTALCDTFRRNGSCSYGDQCRFAHNQEELRVPTQPRGRMHPKYKTVLCENFERDGECKYGSRCMYIHRRREDKLADLLKYRPEAVPSFLGQPASLQSMDHRPPRQDKERRQYRPSSRAFVPAAALNQTLYEYAAPFLPHTWNADLSLPHCIADSMLIHNSSSHEKLANITRTAPSPTNPFELDGRRSRGSDDLTSRVGRKNSRYPKEG